MDREKYYMGSYTIASDNALREKFFWHTNDRRLSVENFDRENVDELIKICQIRQYFSPSKFCAIQYFVCQPAGLPAVRPGSASAMAPDFSHKKGNRV